MGRLDKPRMQRPTVADLHALLNAAGEAGPYVLVGYSYGALIVRHYASTYPKEVSGLVIVDALSEGLRDAETPNQLAIQRKLIEGELRESVKLGTRLLKGSTWTAVLTKFATLLRCVQFLSLYCLLTDPGAPISRQ